MNCEKNEQNILLAESGELAPEASRELETHLSVCASCRSCRDDVRRLAGMIPAALGEASPSPVVMQAILSAAPRPLSQRRLVFERAVLKPLAWAATLALAAGGWWFLTRRHDADRIHEVTAIVAALSERELPGAGKAASRESAHALRRLADALLLMEGLTDDESADSDMPAEEINPQGEPSPTVLQPRSTPAPSAKRCV